MKRTNRVSLVGSAAYFGATLALVACQGEIIEYYPPPGAVGGTGFGSNSGSGGEGPVTGGGGPVSSGGASSGGMGPVTGGYGGLYQRSGYGGGPQGFQGVTTGPGINTWRHNELFACSGGAVTRSVIDFDTCSAATLCSPYCVVDSDCPLLGTATPRCVTCEGPEDMGCTPLGPACVLECTDDSQCPEAMACVTDARGQNVCMFPDVLYKPGCEGYCGYEGLECDASAPCCNGLTCSAQGICTAAQ